MNDFNPSDPTGRQHAHCDYAKLKQLARRALRQERRNHTLTATDLTHNVYLRMTESSAATRPGSMSSLMWMKANIKQFLIDYARRKSAAKRAPDSVQSLSEIQVAAPARPSAIESPMRAAIESLRKDSPKAARLCDLRMQGYTFEEIALKLSVCRRTIGKLWNHAKQHIHETILRSN